VDYQKDRKIKTAIELGCGPFTNIRTIIDLLPDLEELHLLDPLINDYLDHPNCKYKNKKMSKFNVVTHNYPIEDFKTENKYDLVIMNNVLEHCFDIDKIFKNILDMLNPNGFFIFSDVYFEKEDVERMVNIIYDAGHPIRLSSSYMYDFLNNFTEIYNLDLHGLYGQDWRNDKYFIGIKKSL
jgi:SAM-dependent methyltransferase